MKFLDGVQGKIDCVAIVGLGYVGLPLAVAFAEKVKTLGMDTSQEKIAYYRQGKDLTGEVGHEKLGQTKLEFTSDPTRLSEAHLIIVAVPTPVNGDKSPNLKPLVGACEMIGANMSRGSIVVFESTVYPGVTEDVCGPTLEKVSGLVCGSDFKIGYSPERINPGDRVHRLDNICKIVSGMDEETTCILEKAYSQIIPAGVYRTPNIKVAEAAKLVENAQRDINIAFMNELAMVFDRMGIRTKDVIEAMNTKWNALGFYPGLVGGHCIGVDPYYFIYQAEMLGYHSQIIAAGRKINDNMGFYIADVVIKKMIQADHHVKRSKIYIMGITFKENVPDLRNSKAVDVVKQLNSLGISVNVVDPMVDPQEAKQELDLTIVPLSEVNDADCLVFLVAHQQFTELSLEDLDKLFKPKVEHFIPVLIDVKTIFDQQQLTRQGYSYWSL